MKEKFQGQLGLQSGLQNNQGYYVEKSCLEKKKKKQNKTTSKPKKANNSSRQSYMDLL